MNTTAHAHDLVVVGAGLTGLTCAPPARARPRRRGRVPVRPRLPGAQHRLPGVGRVLDLDALGLCALDSAAVVHVDGRHVRLSSPRRRPSAVKDQVVQHVPVPFLAGLVLDPEVATSRRFVDLMMRMFARGRSVSFRWLRSA